MQTDGRRAARRKEQCWNWERAIVKEQCKRAIVKEQLWKTNCWNWDTGLRAGKSNCCDWERAIVSLLRKSNCELYNNCSVFGVVEDSYQQLLFSWVLWVYLTITLTLALWKTLTNNCSSPGTLLGYDKAFLLSKTKALISGPPQSYLRATSVSLRTITKALISGPPQSSLTL